MKRKIIRALLIPTFICLSSLSSTAQHVLTGFEVRYHSKNPKANGETDFKGETSTLNTDQRLEFLKYFADQVSSYYGDKDLNTEVVSNQEAIDFYRSIKPQPLPMIRKRINLNQWKWISSEEGKHAKSIWKINKFNGAKNILIKDGSLSFQNATGWRWNIPAQTWRYSMSWKVRLLENNSKAEFFLLDNGSGKIFVKIDMDKNTFSSYSNGNKSGTIDCQLDKWFDIKIEADMAGIDGRQYYNVFVNDKLVSDYVEANDISERVNAFEVKTSGTVEVDDLYGIGFHQTTEVNYPYYPETFIDENFDIEPSSNGWQTWTYDDTRWGNTNLPFAQGTERYKGEDLFFRKKIKVEDFKRAYLNIETLDPGGEVWVNDKMVSLINDRYPIRLDITKYLKPFAENLIAIRVHHFYLNPEEGIKMPCTYLDFNAGWFAGRASLDLVGETFINDVFIYTKAIEKGQAEVHAKIDLEHKGTLGFKGKLKIKITIWNELESTGIKTVVEYPVLIGPGIKELNADFSMDNAKLWTPESPSLYKVVVEVENKDGVIIDDYVLTTGIRTISQEGGAFRLNGKPTMLNGTQIMGYREPIEKMMTWLRCPPDYWVAKEMLMVREMNCNMLRVHVHGWQEKAVGIADPRYCELADQMGIMLIWCPPAWMRDGDWGQIDFEGYHKYMKLLQNHPSIVMWEVSNHPNTFKNHEIYESDLFCEKSYNAVYPYDPSRLISLTSHIGHLHYGDDEGTIDQGGNKIPIPEISPNAVIIGNQDALTSYGTKQEFSGDRIVSSKAWTAPMVTRGNQDAATGYGAEWSRLRTWPGAYRQGFLDSKKRAYFNFEHQESIGQPNWSLCRGKPWYNLQSYEWGYDIGSIGRKLNATEWRESQAWQAFSAYEAIKKLRMLDYDGFSWCCLHGGANAATYKKPVIDYLGHAKLAFHIHKTVFNKILAGSNNVDIVYGPEDLITPIILNLGEERIVKLTIIVRNKYNGQQIDKKVYKNVRLPGGRTLTALEAFKPRFNNEGLYFIEYLVDDIQSNHLFKTNNK